jgi:hypothetical protein
MNADLSICLMLPNKYTVDIMEHRCRCGKWADV